MRASKLNRVSLLILFAQMLGSLSAQTCPTCAAPSYFSPLSNGRGSSGDGRRIITVSFNSSALVDNNGASTPGTTNVNFYNALNAASGAINTWNNAGNSGYYLQFTTDCSQADVDIGYAYHTQVSGDCGSTALRVC